MHFSRADECRSIRWDIIFDKQLRGFDKQLRGQRVSRGKAAMATFQASRGPRR
jgi:hypothetical protein